MKTVTVKEAYALADWAVRIVCPAILEYDDGKRKAFPLAAKRLRDLFRIRERVTAQNAIQVLSKEVIPPLCEYRDGQMTVPLRQAHWLCMAAINIEDEHMIPADYGSEGIRDLAEYMRVPLHV